MLALFVLAATPVYTYKIVNTFPHDRGAFTQGLQFVDGILYEGTGLNGQSTIRKVKLDNGEVIQRQSIPAQYFGEGITVLNGQLFQLTWQTGTAFVYDARTFRAQQTFTYKGEGWGLTTDGRRLIMSDGTNAIRMIDPKTFQETSRITVTDNGQPVPRLNELEFIKGEIYANVWETNRIARINPGTGRVNSWVDLSGILSLVESAGTDVLNGIAYDAKADRLFVTGKLWPKIYEIKIVPRK